MRRLLLPINWNSMLGTNFKSIKRINKVSNYNRRVKLLYSSISITVRIVYIRNPHISQWTCIR